jgi:hypothetical protein
MPGYAERYESLVRSESDPDKLIKTLELQAKDDATPIPAARGVPMHLGLLLAFFDVDDSSEI